MAKRLLAMAMDITDTQNFLGYLDISATRIYADEASIAMLHRKFDQVTDPVGRGLAGTIRQRQGDVVGAFAADLLAREARDLT